MAQGSTGSTKSPRGVRTPQGSTAGHYVIVLIAGAQVFFYFCIFVLLYFVIVLIAGAQVFFYFCTFVLLMLFTIFTIFAFFVFFVFFAFFCVFVLFCFVLCTLSLC